MSNELPSIEELKASQSAGATGKGTSEKTYAELEDIFDHGTGTPVEDDGEADYEPWK